MNLPIGYQPFHKQPFFNYQLNRLHALGYAREEDLRQAAALIHDRADYVRVMEELAAAARADGRLKNAAFYLRGAEFFVPPDSPRKNDIYREFIATFDEAFAGEGVVRHAVPYQNSCLPALTIDPQGGPSKGNVVVFGGFDSLIEEFLVIWRHFAEAGYRVIAFEGPGQGGALRLYGHHFDHDWEKPMAAVLDHFGLEDTTLIGISMGGYWALRAAAFEPRITRVVSWSPVYDWLEQIHPIFQSLLHRVLKWERFMNATIRLRMRLFPILDHAVSQAIYMAGGTTPMDGVRWMMGMNKAHLHSERVTQDVLLVGGENDAFQPVKLLRKQEAALVNARSITTRIFTKDEHADMHCQMGNLNLALGEIEGWMREKGEGIREQG